MKLPTLAEMRKFATAGVGVVAEAVALGLFHGTLLHYAQLVIAGAVAVGVFVVPNKAAA